MTPPKTYEEFTARYADARCGIIAREFPELNPNQLQATLKTEGAVRIVAGAGSGKTATLIARTANILKYGRGSDCPDVPEDAEPEDLELLEHYLETGDPALKANAELLSIMDKPAPWNVLVVTFTNKAAKELRDRLAAKIGDTGRYVKASTFHSLCLGFLHKFGSAINIPERFGICDDDDTMRLVKQVQKALAADNNLITYQLKPKELASAISKYKHDLRNPDINILSDGQVPNAPEAPDDLTNYIRAAYISYQRMLTDSDLLDFDDLILRTYDMLGVPSIRAQCQRMYQYVMVDEYQDTDPIQDAIIRILSAPTGNMCVVGDDDQSIYGFRGASVDIFRQFDQHHVNAMTIKLEQNYRSVEHIIGAANTVIGNNKIRIGKTMRITRPGGSPVQVRTLPTQFDEAEFIVQTIQAGIAAGRRYSDYLVLTRGWHYIDSLEPSFISNAIPYDIPNSTTFYTSQEIKDVIAYLRVALNPNNTVHMTRIVTRYLHGVGEKAWDNITTAAALRHISPIDVMASRDILSELKMKRAIDNCLEFAENITDMNAVAHNLPLANAVSQIIDMSDCVEYWEDQIARAATDEDAKKAERRIQNIDMLREIARQYSQSHLGLDDNNLPSFLESITLDDSMNTPGTAHENKNVVTLMTAHKSKGLEYPVVFIAGAAQGKFPMTMDTTPIEEERRLFYVAMTRAKDELYITRPERIKISPRNWQPADPSMFLDELPLNHIQK